MAVSRQKKTCIRCGKSGGVFTCDGCEKSFCGQHTVAHRQELAQQLDLIGQEHDLLRRDLTNNTGQNTILDRINAWEKKSIAKITIAAEKARSDLRQFRKQLEVSCNELSDELRESREMDNYSENDLNRWMEKLKLLRKELEMPTRIDIEQKQSKDSIHLLMIHQMNVTNTTATTHDRFDEVSGYAILSEDCLTATNSGSNKFEDPNCSIRGAMLYSAGLYKIHFKIANKTQDYLFFGIVSSHQQLTTNAFSLSSTYGWWDTNYPVQRGQRGTHHKGLSINTGDKITLTLDCDSGYIGYVVDHTKQSETLKVDMNSCLLPWKFLIVMGCKGDSVQILPI